MIVEFFQVEIDFIQVQFSNLNHRLPVKLDKSGHNA